MNGIPVAFKYDDFWSYSAKVLDAIQKDTSPTNFLPVATFGTYDFSVGTGNIPVNITSNAGGATNVVGALTFQDPVNLGSSNTDLGWTGVWGGLTQSHNEYPSSSQDYSHAAALEGGTTTVGNLLAYLHTLDPLMSVPVIYADYNQTGSFDSLWFSAKVQIWDSTQTTLKGEWDLDTLLNFLYNSEFPTFNYGVINFYGSQSACTAAGPYNPTTNPNRCAGVTANGDEYLSLDHNKGSGKPDFLAYAPDLNLNNFLASDLFVVTGNLGCIPGVVGPLGGPTLPNGKENALGCNTNGGEEFGFVGALAPAPPSQAPEPGPLALIALGLGVLCWNARRRQKN